MKKATKSRTTVTVRLTQEEHATIQKLCRLKRTTQTSYLATLAAQQARDELLAYAVSTYQKGEESISGLVRKTGLDAGSIMDGVAATTANDRRPIEAFLASAKAISRELKDEAFYKLALRATNAGGH